MTLRKFPELYPEIVIFITKIITQYHFYDYQSWSFSYGNTGSTYFHTRTYIKVDFCNSKVDYVWKNAMHNFMKTQITPKKKGISQGCVRLYVLLKNHGLKKKTKWGSYTHSSLRTGSSGQVSAPIMPSGTQRFPPFSCVPSSHAAFPFILSRRLLRFHALYSHWSRKQGKIKVPKDIGLKEQVSWVCPF